MACWENSSFCETHINVQAGRRGCLIYIPCQGLLQAHCDFQQHSGLCSRRAPESSEPNWLHDVSVALIFLGFFAHALGVTAGVAALS